MNSKYIAGICVIGSLLAAGCNGAPTIDTAKLPEPVNMAMPATAGGDSQIVAANSLGRIGQPAVAALTTVLSDSDPVVRLQACRALAYMGSQAQEAVPYLTQTLRDPNEGVRQQAAIALGQIGPPSAPAVPLLLQMMKGTEK